MDGGRVPTLDEGTYLGQGGREVPILDGGIFLGWRGYLPWMEGVPTLDVGVPTLDLGGTYLGWGYVPFTGGTCL